MKNLLSFILFLSLGTLLMAQQSFSISDSSKTIQGDATDNVNFYGQIDIQNQTGGFHRLVWNRTSMNLPSAWGSSVCDKTTCYPNATSTEELVFGAWGFNYVNVHFYPNNMSGTGTVKIDVYAKNDPSDLVTLTFIGTTEAVGVEDEISSGDLISFPNPVSDRLHLKTSTENFHALEYSIMDLQGRVLRSGTNTAFGSTFTLQVADLEAGVYLVQLSGENGKTWRTRFLKN